MRQTQKGKIPLLEEWSRHIDHVTETFVRGFREYAFAFFTIR